MRLTRRTVSHLAVPRGRRWKIAFGNKEAFTELPVRCPSPLRIQFSSAPRTTVISMPGTGSGSGALGVVLWYWGGPGVLGVVLGYWGWFWGIGSVLQDSRFKMTLLIPRESKMQQYIHRGK